jgi:hypothetical protein
MQYNLSTEFTRLEETSGLLYPPDRQVEVAASEDTPTKGDGAMVRAGQKYPFTATKGAIYARATSGSAILNVLPLVFATSGSGGSSGSGDNVRAATEAEIDALFAGGGA